MVIPGGRAQTRAVTECSLLYMMGKATDSSSPCVQLEAAWTKLKRQVSRGAGRMGHWNRNREPVNIQTVTTQLAKAAICYLHQLPRLAQFSFSAEEGKTGRFCIGSDWWNQFLNLGIVSTFSYVQQTNKQQKFKNNNKGKWTLNNLQYPFSPPHLSEKLSFSYKS